MKQQQNNVSIIGLIFLSLLSYIAGVFTQTNFIISIIILICVGIILYFSIVKVIKLMEEREEAIHVIHEHIPVIGSGRIDWEEYLYEKQDIPPQLKCGEAPKFDRNKL